MRCSRCGAEFSSEFQVCPHCGQIVYQSGNQSSSGKEQPAGQDQYAGQSQYSGQNQYTGQDQYSGQSQYSGQGQYSGQSQYSGQNQYAGQNQYSGQNQYAGQDQYSGQNQYAGQNQYSGQDQYTGQNTPEPPRQENDLPLKIVLTIFGILAAGFALAALFPALGDLFSSIGRLRFTPAGLIRFLLTLVGVIFEAAVGIALAALAFLLFLSAFRHNRDNTDPFMLGILGAALATVVCKLLVIMMRAILNNIFGRPIISQAGIVPPIVVALLSAAAAYGLLTVTGYKLFAGGLGGGALKETASRISPAVSGALQKTGAPKKAAAASQASGAAAGYTGPGAAAPVFNPGTLGPATGSVPLKSDRSLLLYFLLSLITCGIYKYYFIYKLAGDVNAACSGDGDLPVGGLGAYIGFSILTCGVYSSCWEFNLVERIRSNAPRYGFAMEDDGVTLLLWRTLGSCLCGVGWFISYHKLFQYANQLCGSYNRYNGLA